MGNNVRLYIAIVVLASPDEPSRRLESLGNHVINEAVLIINFVCLKLGFIVSGESWEYELEVSVQGWLLLVVNLLKDVLEATVVLFQNGVLRAEIERPFLGKSILEAAVGKTSD